MNIISRDINSLPGFTHDLWLYNACSFPTLHIHRSAELIFVLDGRLELTVADGKISLESGESALILPFEPHAFAGDSAKFYVYLFADRFACEFYAELDGKRSATPSFRPSRESVDYYLSVFSLSRNPKACAPTTEYAVHCSDFAAMSGISAMLTQFSATVPLSADSDGEFRRDLLSFIDKNYRGELDLTAISAHFGYEPYYLCRLIRRTTGIRLGQLIVGFRIEEAKRLLNQNSLGMTEIASEYGFGTLRSFDRSFKAAVGISPSEWRTSRSVSPSTAVLERCDSHL